MTRMSLIPSLALLPALACGAAYEGEDRTPDPVHTRHPADGLGDDAEIHAIMQAQVVAATLGQNNALVEKHRAWHEDRSPATGCASPGGACGRMRAPAPGGLEFLHFHHRFMGELRRWYVQNRPSLLPAARPWSRIPVELYEGRPRADGPSRPRVSADRNQEVRRRQERRFQTTSNFADFNALGLGIEAPSDDIRPSMHGWLHLRLGSLYPQDRDVLADMGESPRSTFFMNLHGVIQHWWKTWSRARCVNPPADEMTAGMAAACPVLNVSSPRPSRRAIWMGVLAAASSGADDYAEEVYVSKRAFVYQPGSGTWAPLELQGFDAENAALPDWLRGQGSAMFRIDDATVFPTGRTAYIRTTDVRRSSDGACFLYPGNTSCSDNPERWRVQTFTVQ
jgi:hypothetical protein